jgi:hypothetical protein
MWYSVVYTLFRSCLCYWVVTQIWNWLRNTTHAQMRPKLTRFPSTAASLAGCALSAREVRASACGVTPARISREYRGNGTRMLCKCDGELGLLLCGPFDITYIYTTGLPGKLTCDQTRPSFIIDANNLKTSPSVFRMNTVMLFDIYIPPTWGISHPEWRSTDSLHW